MALSRRKFLKAGAFVSLAAGIPLSLADLAAAQHQGNGQNPSKGFPISYESQQDPVFHFRKSTFTPYIGTEFLVSPGSRQEVSIKLVQISDAGSSADKDATETPGNECFSLQFLGSRGKPLKQNTYTFGHGALGTFALFLVPVGKDDGGGRYYEAIINHRLQ
jgi:hypothetical protein